ncbi:MAG: transposase [Leucobacter sp.]
MTSIPRVHPSQRKNSPDTPGRITTLVQRLKGRTAYAVRREFTGACVRARMRGHLWSPSYFAVSCGGAPLSIIKQYIDGQARPL